MTDHGGGSRSSQPGVRPDGGRDESDDERTDSFDDRGAEEFDDDRVEEVEVELGESRGGFLSRIFPGRDRRIRSLKQQLAQEKTRTQQLRTQLKELESRIQELERANETLEETKASYEQRQFRMDALLASVGRSFDQASDELADYDVSVGDLDITLHADVSGGEKSDTLDLRLVGPDEAIDPDRLSTLSFSVGRRGRLRHYGHQGAQQAGGGRVGPLTTGAPPTGEEADTDTVDETDEDGEPSDESPTAPPVEVPNVNGLPADDAEAELRDEGFETHREYRPSETPVGSVVEQWPRAFAVAPRGSSVVVFVGGEETA